MMMSILFISDIKPIKYEEWKGDIIYVHIWKVCVWFNRPMIPYTDHQIEKCYPDVYRDNEEAWYTSIQVLYAISVILSIFSFLYSIVVVIVTNNSANRRFHIPGYCLMFAAACLFIPQVLYEAYFPFDQIGDVREWGIGWTEEIEHNEYYGENYLYIWACMCVCICACITTFIIGRKDRVFAKKRDTTHAQYTAQSNGNGVYRGLDRQTSRDELIRNSGVSGLTGGRSDVELR